MFRAGDLCLYELPHLLDDLDLGGHELANALKDLLQHGAELLTAAVHRQEQPQLGGEDSVQLELLQPLEKPGLLY